MNPLPAAIPAGAEPAAQDRGVSLVGLLLDRVTSGPDSPAVVDGVAAATGATSAHSWTWSELAAAAAQLAADLRDQGLVAGDRVVHIGPHAPDWLVVHFACLLAGVVHVPLHADAATEEHRRQLEWLDPRGVAFSTRITGLAAGDVAGRIVVDLTPRGPLATAGLGGERWRRLAAEPIELRSRVAGLAETCDPQACCCIVLSSGTTGLPHGVMHSQRSLAANAVASAAVFLDAPRDVRLSWLPASHALALTGDVGTALVRGGCLNVVSRRSAVLDACRAVPPTVILGVPAFFERLEQGARSGRIDDLAAALGGAVRVCISGGAPLRRRTAEFFAARGVPLVEGYGLAEAGPVVALANPRTGRIGAVGRPLSGVEVRIDDRPGTRGQLLVRTPARALGILSPHGAAAAAMATDDDWLATGDLAAIDDDGQLRISGRLGDTLVLSTGVKLPPAVVEAALAEDEAVAQVCVVGAGLPRPVAIVVPEPGPLRAAIRRLGIVILSRRHAVTHPRVVAWLMRRLARRQAALPRSWRVRTVVIADRPFDVARGEVTMSLKPRRDVIAARHRDRIIRGAAGHEPTAAETAGAAHDRGDCGGSRSWINEAIWQGGAGGFATAAALAAEPPPDRVEAVLERAEREIARLRDEGTLYESLPGRLSAAPIADAPPPPGGVFTAEAERALGDAGLWGLAVPVEHGGGGCSLLDLARAITRVAANVPTAAGMLGVHSSIGAVSALIGFGSVEQRARLLPSLAAGRPLSIFAATEPDAGCDLARVTTVVEDHDGRLLLTGTKMFITGATHGRLVKLLARRGGAACVVLVRLPESDTPGFRLRRYPLHPLKHAHNAALEFTGFEVESRDVLDPGGDGDPLRIIWHGLNRGRVTLAAQAAGTLRLLLAHTVEHARHRVTWGRPIASRQLVQGRLGRIAAAVVACDAVAAWAAAAVDAGQAGEWEAITAKVLASSCVRDAAIDALGVHGGRAFLVGHPLGDAFHDHFAVGVYEGESDLLGLALFKGLAKHHPLAARRDAAAWRRAGAWLAWRTAAAAAELRQDGGILDRRLREHARHARRRLSRLALAIDRAIRRHGRALAERQLEVGALSAAVRDAVSVVAVAHHADAAGDDALLAPADVWCRLALARSTGRAATADDLAALGLLGRTVSEPLPG
ncbi:MAG: AMP-binding protein [Planctomycetaceae bacterium]